MNHGSPKWEGAGTIEARYANCFKIGHNAFEFVIDCGQMTDETDDLRLSARIVTNPRSAEALYLVLKQTLDEYESTFGVISYGKED